MRGVFLAKLLLRRKKISKSFGTAEIVNELSVRLLRGDRLGIVGPNGAGKSNHHQDAHRTA